MKTPEEVKKGLRSCFRSAFDPGCDDCPYANGGVCGGQLGQDALAYIHRLEDHFADVSKMVAPAEPASKWIDVNECQPEHFKRVLVVRKGADGPIVEQGFKDVGDWWKVYGTRTKKVFFWMPLPEPPEKETK